MQIATRALQGLAEESTDAALAVPGRHRAPMRVVRLRAYLSVVIGLGTLITALILRQVDLLATIRDAPLQVWLLAIALLLGELTRVPVARGDETHDVSMSTTFAVALACTGPFAVLLLTHSVAVVVDDLRTRRSPAKIAFSFGQYAICLVVARVVYSTIGGHPFLAGYTPLQARDLVACLAAGFMFTVLNNAFVAVLLAMDLGQPVSAMLREDVAFTLEASAVLLGLAPVAAVLVQTSGWLLPLIALPVLAVRRSAALAAARQNQALGDVLTGLGNRALFFSRTERMLHLRRHTDEPLAVLMIDLDHFKDINDTLGHQIGDKVIQEVANRIQHAGGERACVARLGGDEFAVAIPGLTVEQVSEVATELLNDIVRPLQIGGTRLVMQASVGIAMAEPGLDITGIMQQADIALYEAKRERARWCLYDVNTAPASPERLSLLADLRDAIDGGQLTVAFQPQVYLGTGRVAGAEALARWEHPERGPIAPEEFIALAEHAGLIDQVTELVLAETLTALAAWSSMGLECRVSVNLSARQLADLSLPERLQMALLRHGVQPNQLTVEVTESSIMGDPRRAGQVLHQLRREGIRIAVDDFGTGYSSLAYLQRLDLDELKVDRSFVQSMGVVARDDVLVRSIIELAHNLGLSVVAEGVEDIDQMERLRHLGCDAAQGYLLGRPMDRDSMTTWLRQDLLLEAVQPGPERLEVGTRMAG